MNRSNSDFLMLMDDLRYFFFFRSFTLVIINLLFEIRLNDTAELEARVTVLEEQMVDVEDNIDELTDEIDDGKTANILQDETLNSMDDDISNNEDTINSADSLSSSPMADPREH